MVEKLAIGSLKVSIADRIGFLLSWLCMKFESPRARESISSSRVTQLADTAQEWAQTLDLRRNPSAHISKALQGVREGRERDLMFGAIRRELNRREREINKESAEDSALLKEARALQAEEKRAQTFKDAYAHQMRQPRDAWDPNPDSE